MSQPTNCDPSFTSGSTTIVLDAPRTSTTTSPLPANFRSMAKIANISGANASGSAEFSRSQFLAMISQKVVTTPMVVVDLRQESHGFMSIQTALNGDTEIAIAWFAERDWLNVAKGLPSVLLDEATVLSALSKTTSMTIFDVQSKTAEDGICTATPYTVKPTGTCSDEQTLVQGSSGVTYLRLPSTDHCRPRDTEVDQFVAFEQALPSGTWLHFHCRAGDGRTTTFMAMHDIIHNAPADSLQTILTRQGPTPNGIGGIDLSSFPTNPDPYSYPFAVERVQFVQAFYSYVVAAKPGGFKLSWSDWVTQQIPQQQLAVSA